MAVNANLDMLDALDLALIADDDDLLLHAMQNGPHTRASRPTFSSEFSRFDFNKMSDERCKALFRFYKNDIPRLKAALAIPPVYNCPDGSIVNGLDGLCVLLRRLAYPNRLLELEEEIGRPKSVISAIVTTVLDDIYARFQNKLSALEQPGWLTRETLCEFARAIYEKDAPLKNCWGFIDGTPRPISRPSQNQKVCFSGHKRYHCLKFQSVVTPNGLIANLFGPVEGRRHDSAMLRMSLLLEDLQRLDFRLDDDEETPLCLYGDPAYPLRDQLIGPYKGAYLTEDQKRFNKKMSAVRESVEWQFGKIVNNFAFLDFKKNLKLYLQPVGKLYMVGALLMNCHTCLYGSETGAYFGVDPPALEDYLGQ